MNWMKGLMAATLSFALIIPTAGGMVSAATNDDEPSVATAGVELRSTLGHLMSEHGYLAIEAMRKGAQGSADFEASTNALAANTEDLSNAIASVYGDDAGASFKEMWSAHIGYFVDYVKATGANDEDAKQMALDELSQYRKDFSQFLETATEERLEAGALADGLQMHVNQLIGAFDSYVAGDFDKAYEYEREAIGHLHMVAKGLSSAITDQFPEKFNNTKAVTPAGDLRATLNHLLSEHAGLAMMAMQNGIDGSEDFEASANALSANTDDLAAAITSVYGEEAGQAFKEMWSAHISYFVDYVKATGADDEEAKQAALDELEQYRADFSAFIENATGGEVPASALSEGLQEHVNQLIGAFNSYVDEDYEKAYETIRNAYGHMYGSAKALSGGIVAQSPEEFANQMPSDMPKTGLVNTSAQQNMEWAWMLTGFLIVAAATTGFVIRRKKTEA
ncbi:copper amine oxidase [Radiobacillus sp. PE A8.2]|uniref:copper amine oxidase n=1 Tax=Radiobacillus sp. PE A8.2 TaxID=3380349 RepID=UPI00388EF43A